MKLDPPLKQGLDLVRKYRRGKRFDRALREIDELLETRQDNAQLLVIRAELIQLQDDEQNAPTLSEAKSDLELAVSLDDQSANAWNELGHYLFAVEDDPKSATKCFDKVVKLSREVLRQALLAQADVLSELGRDEDAIACLWEAYGVASRDGKSGRSEVIGRLKAVTRSDQ